MIYTDSLESLKECAAYCQEALGRGHRWVTIEVAAKEGNNIHARVRLWPGCAGQRLSPGGKITPTVLVSIRAEQVVKAYNKQKFQDSAA
jgi:hypothetical protein